MSFIDIMKSVAITIGIDAPQSVTGTDPDLVKLRQFINDAGTEVARRVDWTALRKAVPLVGNGTDYFYPIADDFDRLPPGLAVMGEDGSVRGSLTADEWFSLTPFAGDPRYFHLSAGKLGFYPYPRSNYALRVQYQSKNWADNNGEPAPKLMADADTTPLPEDVLSSGANWRWRRSVGKDFADEMAEFEAMLEDRAKFDGGVRSP